MAETLTEIAADLRNGARSVISTTDFAYSHGNFAGEKLHRHPPSKLGLDHNTFFTVAHNTVPVLGEITREFQRVIQADRGLDTAPVVHMIASATDGVTGQCRQRHPHDHPTNFAYVLPFTPGDLRVGTAILSGSNTILEEHDDVDIADIVDFNDATEEPTPKIDGIDVVQPDNWTITRIEPGEVHAASAPPTGTIRFLLQSLVSTTNNSLFT